MRGEQRGYRIRWAVAIAWLAAAALLLGCPGGGVLEDTIDGDQVGLDTFDVDTSEPGDTEPETIAYGEILLEVFPPEPFCGCSLSEIGWQGEGSLGCGWHISDSFFFRVRAEHTALGLVGPDGIAQVKLWQHWPAGEDKKLKTLSNPDDGLFTFQLEASQLTLTEGNPDGNYWLRVEVVSAIAGPDGLPMTRDLVIPLDVDTTGPAISIISPATGQKLSGATTVVFTGDDGEAASGVAAFQVLHQKGPGQWEPLEATFEVTNPNGKDTYVSSLDLSEFATYHATTLRVQGEDCLGNVSFADVAVRIIAIPRFVTPPTFSLTDDEGARFERIQAVQGDGLTGNDPEEVPLDLLLTGNRGIHVAWGHPDGTFDTPILAVSAPEAIDSRFEDMTGDGVPDLIVLAPESGQDERVVALWIQDTEPGTKPKGKRTFQLKEKRNVQLLPSKLDIADVTSDQRPDVLVISVDENESLNVLHHTGKTAGIPGDPSAYLDYPKTFTGVTGGVDIGHADVNGDTFVDVIIGREGSGWLTTYVNNGSGSFPIGVDSLVGFGGGLTRILVVDLHDGEIESPPDVIIYHEDLMALMMLENSGNGYFNHPGLSIGMTMEMWGNKYSGSQVQEMALDWSDEIESGRLVIVDTAIGGLVRGNFDGDDIPDLAVTSSNEKLVRIYRGDPPPEPEFGDDPEHPEFHFLSNFHQERFLNAGESPGDLAAGDFNGDGMDDLAVLHANTTKITLLMSENGNYHATTEIPMPLKAKWSDGQITPTMALVADFGRPMKGGSTLPDTIQDLVVFTEPVPQTWLFPATEEGEDEDIEEDISVSLLLTYMGLGLPDGSNYAPIKTAISHRMNNVLSGAAVGNFDGNLYPDIAICTKTDPGSITDSGNFDILRGAITPLTSTPSAGDVLHHFPGRFWPLGGFIGPRNPTDIATAELNDDALDDVILVAGQVGEYGTEEMQFSHAVGYITRNDMSWSSCPNSYNQVSFECCQPLDPELTCGPAINDYCETDEDEDDPQAINKCSGPRTANNSVGNEPVKVLADYISYNSDLGELDKEVPDVITLNHGSYNFSYFEGDRPLATTYAFQSVAGYPNTHPIGPSPVDIDVGDLDADGLPDVVAALQNSLVIAYGLDADLHSFELGVPLEKGPDSQDMTPTGVLMADVNLDGYVDIVTSSTSKSLIWIYVSGGDRDFLGPYPFECGKDPVDVVEIIFEEPKEPDDPPCVHLAVVNAGSRSISILLNEAEACD